MADPDYSSMSGFLGFRARPRIDTLTYKSQEGTLVASDQEEAMSVTSVASERLCDFFASSGSNRNKNDSNKKKPFSSALSVVSDISSTSPKLDESYSNEPDDSSHDFLIQCRKGEMIFVPSTQGKLIKSRCRHFRNLLGMVVDDDDIGDETGISAGDDHIVHKEGWSIGTARHVIELLTLGTTWIENDAKRFALLSHACEEIGVRLCLGSLINYHDIIDRASTTKFFELMDTNKYQFKIRGEVKSWQWIHLLHKGILLLSKTNVLLITVAPPSDGTAQMPTSAKSTKMVSKVSPVQPSHARLAKCDELYSEFRVYCTGSKINALLTILSVLSKGVGTDGMSNNNRVPSRKGNSNFVTRPPEEFKVVYRTKIGSLEQEDMNMLWRLTSASYTVATPDECQHLKRAIPQGSLGTSASRHQPAHHPSNDEGTVDINHINTGMSSENDWCSGGATAVPSSPASSALSVSLSSCNINMTDPSAADKYQVRTLTGNSFVILKHLFDPINESTVAATHSGPCPSSSSSSSSPGRDYRHEPSSPTIEPSDPSMLPACLLVHNPTPDTLGRFLNAAAVAALENNVDVDRHGVDDDVDGGNVCGDFTIDVGWEILPPTASVLFVVSHTSRHLKRLLGHLADYSNSAIVDGPGDFSFVQRPIRKSYGSN